MRVRGCGARVRCARVRGCAGARVRGCAGAGARVRGCGARVVRERANFWLVCVLRTLRFAARVRRAGARVWCLGCSCVGTQCRGAVGSGWGLLREPRAGRGAELGTWSKRSGGGTLEAAGMLRIHPGGPREAAARGGGGALVF